MLRHRREPGPRFRGSLPRLIRAPPWQEYGLPRPNIDVRYTPKAGSSSVNRAPPSGASSIRMSPPMARARRREM